LRLRFDTWWCPNASRKRLLLLDEREGEVECPQCLAEEALRQLSRLRGEAGGS